MSRPRLRSDVNKETIPTDLSESTMAEPEPEKELDQIKTDDPSNIKKTDQELIPHPEMENKDITKDVPVQDPNTLENMISMQQKMGKTLDAINETLTNLTASFHGLETANTGIKEDVDKLRKDMTTEIQTCQTTCDSNIDKLEDKIYQDYNIKHAEVTLDIETFKQETIKKVTTVEKDAIATTATVNILKSGYDIQAEIIRALDRQLN
jgi:hypothetical protein